MTLKELLHRLALGELSNLTWVDQGEIRPEKRNSTTELINEALNKLYARFYLKVESILLDPVDGKTEYELTKDHLMDKTLEPTYDKYLFKPGEKPFNNDILRILKVVTSSGIVLPINNPMEKYSVFTPTYNKLQCPKLKPGWELEIVYASKHPELVYSEDEDPVIELPDSLMPAVCAYVAYQVHNNINTENAVSNAQKYLNLYNSILADNIESSIVYMPENNNNSKFIFRGWI